MVGWLMVGGSARVWEDELAVAGVRVGGSAGVWEDELAVAGVRVGGDVGVWVEELAVAVEVRDDAVRGLAFGFQGELIQHHSGAKRT